MGEPEARVSAAGQSATAAARWGQRSAGRSKRYRLPVKHPVSSRFGATSPGVYSGCRHLPMHPGLRRRLQGRVVVVSLPWPKRIIRMLGACSVFVRAM